MGFIPQDHRGWLMHLSAVQNLDPKSQVAFFLPGEIRTLCENTRAQSEVRKNMFSFALVTHKKTHTHILHVKSLK